MDDGVRILLVDDDTSLRHVTGRLLRSAGYEVLEATTGSDGLRLAREEGPDLILLASVLPDLPGLEVCRRLRADAGLAGSHVVFLSALRAASDDQANSLEAGAQGYIARPLSGRELLARVEVALRLKQTEDALRERTRELDRRVRELDCLYGIAQLCVKPGLSLEEMLEATVALIPSAWPAPELIGARIILADQQFKSSNFRETPWQQACALEVWGQPAGRVEVHYLAAEPESEEGRLPQQERRLLHAIAERLGRIVERLQMEDALRQAEERYRALLELTTDLAYAFRVQPDGGLVHEWQTEALASLSGFTPDELAAGDGWARVIHPEDLPASQRHVDVLLSGEPHTYDLRIVTKEGQVRWLRDSGQPVWDKDQGRVVRIYGTARDITEGKQAEQALRQNEQKLSIRNQINGIFLTYPDEAMYAEVLNLILALMHSEYGTFGYFEEDGSFVAPALTRRIYWDRCNVPEKEIIFKKGTFGGIWNRAIEERKTQIANEGPFRMPEGHVPIQNTMVTPVIFHDQVISAIHLANKAGGYGEQDRVMVEMIAAQIAPVLYARLQSDRRDQRRQRAEEALRRSEERYRLLLESTSDSVYVLDPQWRHIVVNDAAVRFVQVPRETLLENRLIDVFPGIEETVFFKTFQRVMETREPGTVTAEYTFPDGRKGWYEVHVDPVPEGILCVSRDITKRKRAEQELAETTQLLETILDHTHILVAYLDPHMNFVRVNRAYAGADGREPSFFPGKNHFALYPNAENEEIFRRVAETGQPYVSYARPFEYAEHPERGVTYWDWSLIPIIDAQDTVMGLVLTLANVTEQVRAQQQLGTALAEKETLLKEIHHRVKNNLQLVSAMLTLQAKATGDERVTIAFEESQHRILSMAGIHEQLYRAQDLSHVEMATYLRDLADDLQQSYGRPSITVHSATSAVRLDIDQAIPCGLIVNELVSNALKHAFPHEGQEAGEVEILLRPLPEAKGLVELTVSDNGVGLPADLDLEHSETLGLTMVSLLVRQLGGTLALDRNHGTTFRITFSD